MAIPGLVLAGATGLTIAAAPAALVPVVALYAANAAIRVGAETAAYNVSRRQADSLAAIAEQVGFLKDNVAELQEMLEGSLRTVDDEESVGLAEVVRRLDCGVNALSLTIRNELPGADYSHSTEWSASEETL